MGRKRRKSPPSSSEHPALGGLRRRYKCGKARAAASSPPDRGTDELQRRRRAILGDAAADRAVDLGDPIDILEKSGRLQPEQVLAAHVWRARSALVMGGTGPRLAMRRDLGSNRVDPVDERVAAARVDLERIQGALERRGLYKEAARVVLGREAAGNVYRLQMALEAAASALRLHTRR